MKVPKVYIIILNYNNWQDTVECLESVFRNEYINCQVIVVDNNSPDNSMEYIKSWAEGKLDVWTNPNHPLRNLSFPPVEKPIPYVFYTKEEAERGGDLEKEKKLMENIPEEITSKYPLVLIQAGENRGFSAGNNIGIRYALAKDDFEYIWLLNNDTVIEKDTLINLINCVENRRKVSEKYGLFGTLLLYYDKPDTIQALGGKFNRFFATGKHRYANSKLENINKRDVQKFDYIVGASMLLSKDIVEEVGLLDEDYFIYYEEIDYATRAKKKGYKMHLCLDSVVYHKEGATTSKNKSEFSDFFALRNRALFTKKHYPYYLIGTYMSYLISLINRIRRKEYKKAINLIKIMFGKNKYVF